MKLRSLCLAILILGAISFRSMHAEQEIEASTRFEKVAATFAGFLIAKLFVLNAFNASFQDFPRVAQTVGAPFAAVFFFSAFCSLIFALRAEQLRPAD